MRNEPPGWLRLLCAWLLLWEPLRVATELAGSMATLRMRGAAGVAELGAHAAVAAVGVAGAWALWNRNPVGPWLASVAVAASAAVTVQSGYWSYLPVDAAPGERVPRSVLAIAHAAGWMTYLRKSRRVRAAYE